MTPAQFQDQANRYVLRAQRAALPEARTAAMIGMMCVLAAAADRLVNMPQEWEWPAIPPVTE
jgi:hypothetical protein